MTFAVLCPGQLSEKAGMGEALCRDFPAAAELFAEVSARSGVDLAGTFFGEGSPSLHDDLPAQVGVFAVSVAVLDALEACHALVPAAAAGYSLGTYAAFVAAGVLDRWRALDVLLEAQRLLHDERIDGTMGFVIGLGPADVEPLLRSLSRDPASLAIGNRNAPRQLVLTGRSDLVAAAVEALSPRALKSGLLPVRWPMHAPLLTPVTDRLSAFVARLKLAWPGRSALYAPMLGRRLWSEGEARDVLGRQIARASLWEDALLAMAKDGHLRFAEAGPGDVLTKMLRWTLRDVRGAALEEPAGIARFAAGDAAASPNGVQKGGEP